MDYLSTRGGCARVSAARAIVQGLAPDGGLFVPEQLPVLTAQELSRLAGLSYPARAAAVLGGFLPDFSAAELLSFCEAAYAPERFTAEGVAPLVRLDATSHILELFHGPTCAFKDFALQLLPRLLTASLQKTGEEKTVAILTATSGDTGKAALEGFADIPGTFICVFYPEGGTSRIQRLQMTTQRGENVRVAAVRGNFDDTQTGVKRIFTDAAYAAELAGKGVLLSSANSINWGRLAPQLAYYVSAYCELVARGAIRAGERVNVAVPTGNFGNILAAWLAKRCGLPIARLLCASNRNDVLTDFFARGVYDRRRPFYQTSSPSMDILVSSNLERLLFFACGRDAAAVRGWMGELAEKGCYTLPAALHEALGAEFSAGSADEAQTAATIRSVWEGEGYLCDPHTAVAVSVYRRYREASGDMTPTLIAATASPFKFCASVLPALGVECPGEEFAALEALSEHSGLPVPARLAALRGASERFTAVCEAAQMRGELEQLLMKGR